MAATKRNAILRPEAAEKIRAQIQTSQLLNRLTNHALGKPDPASKHKKPVEMSATQVNAALGVLRKSLPDLTATEHKGEVTTRYVAQVPPVAESMEDWQKGANGHSSRAH